MAIKTFIVEGMMCNNCKTHVEKNIKEITGIDEVLADLANNQVRVSGDDIDNQKLRRLSRRWDTGSKGRFITTVPKVLMFGSVNYFIMI